MILEYDQAVSLVTAVLSTGMTVVALTLAIRRMSRRRSSRQ